jgi:hypothetical protein
MERYGLALAKTLVDAANEVVYARVFNPRTMTTCEDQGLDDLSIKP